MTVDFRQDTALEFAEKLEKQAAQFREVAARFPKAYIDSNRQVVAPELASEDCDKLQRIRANKEDGYMPAIMVGEIPVCSGGWMCASSAVEYLIKAKGSERGACLLFAGRFA
jgi:sulfite reductase beta subunit-like hemoprotein